MRSATRPAKVDLFDDPPWTGPAAGADRQPRQPLAVAALGLCALGAVGAAISSTLPWFGLDESTAIGFLHLSDGMSALSPSLEPVHDGSLSPGTSAWGFVILALAGAVALGAVSSLALLLVRRRVLSGASVLLAALAVLLLLAAVLDAHARPPFGDGPPLRFDWGAAVGVTAAVTSLVGAGWAVVLSGRRREPILDGSLAK